MSHLLPSVNHRRIRLKASFQQPLDPPPFLHLGNHRVRGEQTDTEGLFFSFDLDGLESDRVYELQIKRESGEKLCDPWPLKTFPAPDATPEHFRLLAYTCAGGPENLYNFGFFNAYVPIASRQRMFDRALHFSPDAVVANGDHVYWDLESSAFMGRSLRAKWVAGLFDDNQPVLGTSNEAVLKRAFGPQIAGLYGVRFRSTPMFFLQDDHDYGENDEASADLRTFPPAPFMLDLARTTQRLYYPEFLADSSLPSPYRSALELSENFGRLRYGRLFDGLLYDCRRFITNEKDPNLGHSRSGLIPMSIEHWLMGITARSDAMHIAHMPSLPVLWTAGKWTEWYADTQGSDGELNIEEPKAYWPSGWKDQHDRLLAVASGRRDRTPLFVSGDLHAIGAGRIQATGDRSFAENPIVSLLVGPVGTGPMGWPSVFRGQRATPSLTVESEEVLEPIEENGFTILDVTPDNVRAAFFRWLPERGDAALDTLEPFLELDFPKPSRRV